MLGNMDDDRRTLCKVAGLALLGTALPACGNNSNAVDMGPLACSSSAVAVGMQITDVPMNAAVFFSLPDTTIWLCRDDNGVYAMDAECTHLGCPAKPTSADPNADPVAGMSYANLSAGFACNCHGATYDANGQHPTAPAPSPLKHYLVCATVSGVAVVDTQQVVDPSIRYHL